MKSLPLGDDWRSCLAVDLALSDPLPYFVYLGEDLEAFSECYRVSVEGVETSLIDEMAMRIDEAVLNKAPISLAQTSDLIGGGRARIRSVLLPLSDNGRDISHIFGAVNGRIV